MSKKKTLTCAACGREDIPSNGTLTMPKHATEAKGAALCIGSHEPIKG